jgi:hypothetical protein
MVFNLEGKARPGRHQAHNIGNLTYISHWLNSYKTGIGSEPLKLDVEPPDNLKSHLLVDRKGTLLKAYNKSCRNADPDNLANDYRRARKYFDDFSQNRRAVITEAFLMWEDSIRNAGRLPETIDKRSAKRLINPNVDDEIADLGYPADVESNLVRLRSIRGMVKSRKLGAEISFGFRRKVDKNKKVQLVRIDLYRSPKEIHFKFRDVILKEWFSMAAPSIPFKERRFKLDLNKPDAARVVEIILEKLYKIAKNDE